MSSGAFQSTYVRTSSQRVKDALALLPPPSIERTIVKPYTRFEVLDALTGKFLAIQQYHDPNADTVPEGIKAFGDYFQSGVILPDGEVLVTSGFYEWRIAVLEYHGGWFITTLEGGHGRSPNFKVMPELWASMLASIDDNHIRRDATVACVDNNAPTSGDYRSWVRFVHDVHRKSAFHRPSHGGVSLVQLCI